jgi:hypothetical protein
MVAQQPSVLCRTPGAVLDKRLPGATGGSLSGQVPPVGLPGKIVPQANVNLG